MYLTHPHCRCMGHRVVIVLIISVYTQHIIMSKKNIVYELGSEKNTTHPAPKLSNANMTTTKILYRMHTP